MAFLYLPFADWLTIYGTCLSFSLITTALVWIFLRPRAPVKGLESN